MHSDPIKTTGSCERQPAIISNSSAQTSHLKQSLATPVNQILSYQQPLNPWNYKPWWCQPWSILLTGVVIILGSWAIIKIIWVTVLVSLPILVWWTYFLVIWPQMMRLSGTLENNQHLSQESTSREIN